jgi:hypothetical protein
MAHRGTCAVDPVLAAHISAITYVSAADVFTKLEEARRYGHAAIETGDYTRQIKGAETWMIGSKRTLFLAFGGPATTDHRIVTALEELMALVRRLDPLPAYAYASFEPSFNWRGQVHDFQLGMVQPEAVIHLAEDIVLDGFLFQLLGGPRPGRSGQEGARRLDPRARSRR